MICPAVAAAPCLRATPSSGPRERGVCPAPPACAARLTVVTVPRGPRVATGIQRCGAPRIADHEPETACFLYLELFGETLLQFSLKTPF